MLKTEQKQNIENFFYDVINSDEAVEDLGIFEQRVVQCWYLVNQLPDEIFKVGNHWKEKRDLVREMVNDLEIYYKSRLIDTFHKELEKY